MSDRQPDAFWREAFTLAESVTPRVLPYVATFGIFSALVTAAAWVGDRYGLFIGLEVGFHEIGGVLLTIALILRTNAGYDRWWEARRLWGGIVNQCRNLAITGLSYGPEDPQWRDRLVRWTATFPWVAKAALQGQALPSSVDNLVGNEDARRLAAASHPPSAVAIQLAAVLRAGSERGMNPLAFAQADKERASLIDHIGGCERILKTPLPKVYSIKIRRVLALFLLTLPFVLLTRVSHDWLIPLICILVAYPLISLDQIGHELQNPFSLKNLSHLPLDDISASIERNVLSLRDVPFASGTEVNSDRKSDAAVTSFDSRRIP